MRQGAEFLNTGGVAWAAWAALRPTCVKVRFGTFSTADYRRAFGIMRLHTNNPLFLFRPQTEVPDLIDLRLRLTEEMAKVPPGVAVWLEPANEPNQTETREGLGNTTAKQVATYRRLLTEWIKIREEWPKIKLIAPGLMPEPGGTTPWMVPERGLYDFDGRHVYGSGLDGLMFPGPLYAPLVITEIGSASNNRSAAVIAMMQWLAERWSIQAFVHFAVPGWGGPDGFYTMTEGDAEAYAAWHKGFYKEEKPMPIDYRKLAHEVIDQAYKDASTEGFNPHEGAFRLYTNAGMPLGPERKTDLIHYRAYALGTLVVPVADPQPSTVRLFPPGLDGEMMLAAYLEALPKV